MTKARESLALLNLPKVPALQLSCEVLLRTVLVEAEVFPALQLSCQLELTRYPYLELRG